MVRKVYDIFIAKTKKDYWEIVEKNHKGLNEKEWFNLQGYYEKQAPDIDSIVQYFNNLPDKTPKNLEKLLRINIPDAKITCSHYETPESIEFGEVLEDIGKIIREKSRQGKAGLSGVLSEVIRIKIRDHLRDTGRTLPKNL